MKLILRLRVEAAVKYSPKKTTADLSNEKSPVAVILSNRKFKESRLSR
jgi:hypothetical protein